MCLVTKVRYQRCSTTSTPSLAESVELRTGCCALLLWRRVLCDGKRSSRARLLPASERHTSSTSEAVEAVELADERAAALPKPGVGYTDL